MENKQKFNLNSDASYQLVIELADKILANDTLTVDNQDEHYQIAEFNAKSKQALEKIRQPAQQRIVIVMNLVHEHHRLLPATETNPNGENSLINKINQLEWLFTDTNWQYDLIYVSGTDQWGSERAYEQAYQLAGSPTNVHLLKLSDYNTSHHYKHNCKGGELLFGMNTVIQKNNYPDLGKFDYFLFTDADMSFDLGQLGIMLNSLQTHDLVIGNRQHPESFLRKDLKRSGIGTPMYRHIQRRLGQFFYSDLNLVDSQCAWKGMRIETLKQFMDYLDQDDWAIDVDMIGCAEKLGLSIEVIPVANIDSPMESHGKAIGDELRIFANIKGVLRIARKYDLYYDHKIAEIVDKYIRTPQDIKRILSSTIPEEFSELPNEAFGDPSIISAQAMDTWLKHIGLPTT